MTRYLVNLGRRYIGVGINNETSARNLEHGRKLRKSDAYPIHCQVQLKREWKDSKHNIETTRRNRQRMDQEGTRHDSVPIEPLSYNSKPYLYDAIIPAGGISQRGYVRKVWIRGYPKRKKICNQSYQIIDPYVHNIEQWIEGFKVDVGVFLLPSRQIKVKYYHKK